MKTIRIHPGSSRGAALSQLAGLQRFTALPPLSLYIHVPWCLKKCPYCDFNSHELKPSANLESTEASYVDALLTDLEFALPQIWGRKLHTVFFGGGTPSLFSPEAIDRILAGVRARVPLIPGAEVTLEANPGTFEREKFLGFREAGVNRLSLGIQSFNPRHLAALGRVHDEREAHAAAEMAIANFPSVNLDLMYALPEQSLAEAEDDARIALQYAPSHLSFYHLTLEPNTMFHRHPPPVPDDDVAADMQEAIEGKLTLAGYHHYETSAFARPGHECRHNLNYWRFGDYLGIGAGAHSKISFADRIVRQVRFKQPRQYLDQVAAGKPIAEDIIVAPDEVGFEFMLNALRLNDGVDATLFAETTGLGLGMIESALVEAERRGLLARDHVHIQPTKLGRRFLNDLQELFLADKAKVPARLIGVP